MEELIRFLTLYMVLSNNSKPLTERYSGVAGISTLSHAANTFGSH